MNVPLISTLNNYADFFTNPEAGFFLFYVQQDHEHQV